MSITPVPEYNYQIGGSLPADAPTYVWRQADEDFYQALQAGEFCYVLNARQMGKSSLKVRTMQRLQTEGVACAAIDLTRIGTVDMSAEQWYSSIIDGIISSLDLYEVFDLCTWWEQYQVLSYVRRLDKFIDEVLLKLISQPIVIFIDEIDCVLSLPFKLDDFFAFIRECYNRRAEKPDYNRLTFALLGVTTPSDLMQDKQRTPFNIGREIELTGFDFAELDPLGQGLLPFTPYPHAVFSPILYWTGGQPFLTQKVFKLVADQVTNMPQGKASSWVAQLVQRHIINHWLQQDVPEHLITIQNRLTSSKNFSRLLELYRDVLRMKRIPIDDSPEQIELRLSGLVIKCERTLQVANQIYAAVFNQRWIEKYIETACPYRAELDAWIESGYDKALLLQGQSLQEAKAWAVDRSLPQQDHRFLLASQDYEQQKILQTLETARQNQRKLIAERQVADARLQQTQRSLKISLFVLAGVSIVLVVVGIIIWMRR